LLGSAQGDAVVGVDCNENGERKPKILAKTVTWLIHTASRTGQAYVCSRFWTLETLTLDLRRGQGLLMLAYPVTCSRYEMQWVVGTVLATSVHPRCSTTRFPGGVN
jgi:hypothetical protein